MRISERLLVPLAFTGVSCGTLPADSDDEIRGRIDGGEVAFDLRCG